MRHIWSVLFIILTLSCNRDNQKEADILFYSALDRLKTGDIDSADINQSIADLSKVITLNPKWWQAYSNRAGLYQQTKQYNKAIADYTSALKYSDRNSAVNLHDSRAGSYYSLGQYQNAIVDWTVAIDNLADPSFAFLNRAKAEWQLGQKDKSCMDYKEAIKLYKELEKHKEFVKCP